MVELKRKNIRAIIFNSIPEIILEEIHPFIDQLEPKLWGKQRPEDFLMICLELTIYKDLTSTSFGILASATHKWLEASSKSLRHNAQVLRPLLKDWAKTVIKLGSYSSRKRAASKVHFKKPVHGVTLWLDSTDFALARYHKGDKKGLWWSFKLNSRGMRFMVMADAKGEIRKLWGGYSPKLYDGDWLKCQEEWITTHLSHDVVIADGHFSWGRDKSSTIKGFPKVLVNYTDRKGTGDMEGVSMLTKEQKKFNIAHAHARARIELPFGQLTTTWKAFNIKWQEPEEQLSCLVWFAFGVYNRKL